MLEIKEIIRTLDSLLDSGGGLKGDIERDAEGRLINFGHLLGFMSTIDESGF
jgi:hypothetical protein